MRLGAWCALFALAIQFTLSFGHAHGFASPFPRPRPAARLIFRVERQKPLPGWRRRRCDQRNSAITAELPPKPGHRA